MSISGHVFKTCVFNSAAKSQVLILAMSVPNSGLLKDWNSINKTMSLFFSFTIRISSQKIHFPKTKLALLTNPVHPNPYIHYFMFTHFQAGSHFFIPLVPCVLKGYSSDLGFNILVGILLLLLSSDLC
ncbi:hypothetical protein CHS0354_009531 [Potamilus streckersoni]|uniref:Uncharacterized protein n=1 Tax=Potamilus streckersoni TaxID=2493646 RepID=A0AAE0W098_9BIVA|nr:hypothetical protein CHS0354_009531 [Potamilus streckersoni]